MRSASQRMALAIVAIGLASTLACSGESDSSTGSGGKIGVDLQLAPGVTVDTVSWSITNGTTFSQSGTVNVQSSNTISFLVGGIPSGPGYTLTLTATTVDGTLTCLGSAPFSVISGATTAVSVNLACSPAEADAGSIIVSGSTSVCANINSLSASPLETSVNGTVALAAVASAGSVPPSYAWTSTAGAFDNPVSATPVFTCPPTPGPVTLTLTVSPNASVCTTTFTQSVVVSCDVLTPTFTNVYADVIGVRCTGCHKPGGSGVTLGNLDMSTQSLAYTNLVDVPASGTAAGTSGVTCASLSPPMSRVAPSNAAASLLFNKVFSKFAGTQPACGSPMPLPATAPPISQAQVDLIEAWITAGAANN